MGQPGLYYDEMLFGNAAKGGRSNLFVAYRLWGIPVLLMDYIGALKAWIYYPLFHLFAVTHWTVRLPSILAGLAGAYLLVAALYRGFGRSVALAGAIMILLDPTILMHSRLDWGPNALMFFFRGGMIFSLVEWARTESPKWAWFALACAVLGIFDKLAFIWVVVAGCGATALLYSRALLHFYTNHKKQAVTLAIIFAALLTVSLLRASSIESHSDITMSRRLMEALGLLRFTMSGGGALNFIAGNGLRLEPWFWPGYFAALAIAPFGYRLLPNAHRRRYWWIIAFLVLLTAVFVLTKSATGPHHSSVVSGVWQLAIAPLLGALIDDNRHRYKRLRLIAVACCLLAILAGSTAANVIGIDALSRPANRNWDNANERAASFAIQHSTASFICADWGFANILVSLCPTTTNILDAWPSFTKQEDTNSLISGLQKDNDVYIYTHLAESENFKGNREHLLQAFASQHVSYEVVGTYFGSDNSPMIEIWKIKF